MSSSGCLWYTDHLPSSTWNVTSLLSPWQVSRGVMGGFSSLSWLDNGIVGCSGMVGCVACCSLLKVFRLLAAGRWSSLLSSCCDWLLRAQLAAHLVINNHLGNEFHLSHFGAPRVKDRCLCIYSGSKKCLNAESFWRDWKIVEEQEWIIYSACRIDEGNCSWHLTTTLVMWFGYHGSEVQVFQNDMSLGHLCDPKSYHVFFTLYPLPLLVYSVASSLLGILSISFWHSSTSIFPHSASILSQRFQTLFLRCCQRCSIGQD